MDFFEIQDIGEANFEIFSPCTTDGLIEVGTYLGLSNSSRVIDFGCGTGELLAIWAQKLGISGLGIDIRESCHKRAVTKIRNLNLAKRIQMIHGMATQYPIENREYDVAVCIASSYTWGGFVQAIAGMSRAIRPVGKLVIGEPYWVTGRIDSHICSKEPFFTERELLDIARYQGFDLEFMFRASRDDLDNYESRLWRGYLDWIETNPNHPEREMVIEHFHKIQNDYFEFDRDNFGWAIYILRPVKYELGLIKPEIISEASISS